MLTAFHDASTGGHDGADLNGFGISRFAGIVPNAVPLFRPARPQGGGAGRGRPAQRRGKKFWNSLVPQVRSGDNTAEQMSPTGETRAMASARSSQINAIYFLFL